MEWDFTKAFKIFDFIVSCLHVFVPLLAWMLSSVRCTSDYSLCPSGSQPRAWFRALVTDWMNSCSPWDVLSLERFNQTSRSSWSFFTVPLCRERFASLPPSGKQARPDGCGQRNFLLSFRLIFKKLFCNSLGLIGQEWRMGKASHKEHAFPLVETEPRKGNSVRVLAVDRSLLSARLGPVEVSRTCRPLSWALNLFFTMVTENSHLVS